MFAVSKVGKQTDCIAPYELAFTDRNITRSTYEFLGEAAHAAAKRG